MGSAAFQIYSKCRSSSWTRRCQPAKAFTTWSNQKPTHTKRKTGRFHINLEQFAKQEDSAPKRFRTKPGAVLAKQEDSAPKRFRTKPGAVFAKQEDSTSTWSKSQNRKIPHQPGTIHRTGRFCIKKIPHQTRYNTHKLAIRDFKIRPQVTS